jgi:hypothetical protein
MLIGDRHGKYFFQVAIPTSPMQIAQDVTRCQFDFQVIQLLIKSTPKQTSPLSLFISAIPGRLMP